MLIGLEANDKLDKRRQWPRGRGIIHLHIMLMFLWKWGIVALYTRAGNSNDVTVFQIPTADAYDYQYLIQNLTVTAFNFNDSGAYVGLRLRLIYTVGTSGTMVSNKLINITGNRTIGPNQTAQIISKDAPYCNGIYVRWHPLQISQAPAGYGS